MKILLAVLLLTLAGCSSLPTQHQQIAAACESAASSLDALTAAKQAGRISAAQLNQAITIYKQTVPVCEPPAQSLDAVKKAALDGVVAELLARQEKAK